MTIKGQNGEVVEKIPVFMCLGGILDNEAYKFFFDGKAPFIKKPNGFNLNEIGAEKLVCLRFKDPYSVEPLEITLKDRLDNFSDLFNEV